MEIIEKKGQNAEEKGIYLCLLRLISLKFVSTQFIHPIEERQRRVQTLVGESTILSDFNSSHYTYL